MISVEIEALKINCARPFVTARTTTTVIGQIVIAVRQDQLVGVGVARCDTTLDSSLVVAARDIASALLGVGLEHPNFWAPLVMKSLGSNPLAVALEAALYDLHGRQSNVPTRCLLRSPKADIPRTALSIGTINEEAAVQEAFDRRDWPILKLKMGPAIGLHTVQLIRRHFVGQLWIDANGSWDIDEAFRNLEFLRNLGVDIVEQPLSKGKVHDAPLLRHSDGPLIAVDDDADSPASIASLAGKVDLVNIKPLHGMGLSAAREAINVARAAGLRVMLGCRTESVAGVTAAAQLAGLVDWLDLDGHLDLQNDPFSGLTIERGLVHIPDGPGMGIKREKA